MINLGQMRGHILNVDDSDVNRYYITRVLQRAGFRVTEAASGEEAIRLLDSKPDLVILDVHLPDVNGIEVCQRIKSGPATAGIPVMHISATAVRSEDRAAGLEGGADAYLTQPVEPRELLATVTALLRARRAEEALRRIQWLLHRSVNPEMNPRAAGPHALDKSEDQGRGAVGSGSPPVGDPSANALLMQMVGKDVLHEIASDYLDLLDSSTVIYEKNGQCALAIFASGWCGLLDRASRKPCSTADHEAMRCVDWPCRQSSWGEAAALAIRENRPVDIECLGGMRIYAAPIVAGAEVVGAISAGYGDPPCDEKTLGEIAARYEVNVAELQRHAEAYESRPPFIVELAKKRLRASARLLGEMVERRRAEEAMKRAKEQAEAASQVKDQFLAVLSHELRTPLTPVMAMISTLQRKDSLGSEVRADLELIRRNVELEARLIDDLLDLTGIARGKLSFNLQPADAHELLTSAAEICREAIAEKGLDLEMRLEAKRHWVMADAGRLQQVFWNLVRNAVKFTPARRGRITIRSSDEEGGVLRVDVIDTGIGIEPEALRRIFNAFEQGEESITRRFGGLGLGLSISKALMDAHGGSLVAASEGAGRGATFTVRIGSVAAPAGEGRGAAQSAASMRLPPEGGRGRRTILLVEDHSDTLRVMARLLKGMDFEVRTAGSVGAALSEAQQGAIDLLISDLGLPDGSGLELMRELKGRYGTRGIALSGYGMEEDLRKSAEAGFEAHLTKPIDLGRLQAAIVRVAL